MLVTLCNPLKRMKKAATKIVRKDMLPFTSIDNEDFKIARIISVAGKAYARSEKVIPQNIFSLCCSGGGMSYCIFESNFK